MSRTLFAVVACFTLLSACSPSEVTPDTRAHEPRGTTPQDDDSTTRSPTTSTTTTLSPVTYECPRVTTSDTDHVCLFDGRASGQVFVFDTDRHELTEQMPSIEVDPDDAAVVETQSGEAWVSFFEGSHCRLGHQTIAWLRMPPDWLLSHFRGRTICHLVDTDNVVVVIGRARLHPLETDTRIGVELEGEFYRVSVFRGSARVEAFGFEDQLLKAGEEFVCETFDDCFLNRDIEDLPDDEFIPPESG